MCCNLVSTPVQGRSHIGHILLEAAIVTISRYNKVAQCIGNTCLTNGIVQDIGHYRYGTYLIAGLCIVYRQDIALCIAHIVLSFFDSGIMITDGIGLQVTLTRTVVSETQRGAVIIILHHIVYFIIMVPLYGILSAYQVFHQVTGAIIQVARYVVYRILFNVISIVIGDVIIYILQAVIGIPYRVTVDEAVHL
ncbi:hypothetical protein FQZ97_971630 [compost metagenome]